MKKRAKKRKPASLLREDRFLVGFVNPHDVRVFGRDFFRLSNRDPQDTAYRMTEQQAREGAKAMACTGATIFELVPVEDE